MMFKEYPEEIFNTTSAECVLKVLFEYIQPKSVLDVGCGNGSWLKAFTAYGVEDILGLDGFYVPQESLLIPKDKFQGVDLSQPIRLEKKYDLVVSLEVAEHLPEAAADTFIETLITHADTILFSAAIPMQGGLNHINEQYLSYWLKKFEQHSYLFYDLIRPRIWDNDKIFFWYRQNIVIAANQNSPIAQKYQPSTWIDFVHPQLFEREAKRAYNFEQGKVGIKNTFNALLKSISRKFRRS